MAHIRRPRLCQPSDGAAWLPWGRRVAPEIRGGSALLQQPAKQAGDTSRGSHRKRRLSGIPMAAGVCVPVAFNDARPRPGIRRRHSRLGNCGARESGRADAHDDGLRLAFGSGRFLGGLFQRLLAFSKGSSGRELVFSLDALLPPRTTYARRTARDTVAADECARLEHESGWIGRLVGLALRRVARPLLRRANRERRSGRRNDDDHRYEPGGGFRVAPNPEYRDA